MTALIARFSTRGHDAALSRLATLLAATPPHALLLVGPAGVGVGTLAHDVAAALLCTAPVGQTPCRSCRSCRLVEHQSHADLHALAPTGANNEIGIDPIRELIATIALLPVEGRRRVALIHRADRLSEPAQHALLKLLEEPPAHTHLILAATEETTLLPTVKSRCATLRLGLPDRAAAVALLIERLAVTPEVALRLLTISEGRPGPLLRSGATAATATAYTALRAELIGMSEIPPLARLPRLAHLVVQAVSLLTIEPLPAAEPVVAGATRGSAAERRAAAGTLLRLWRSVARDLAAVAAGAPTAIRFPEELPTLTATVAMLPPGACGAALRQLDDAVRALRWNPNPELLLDAAALAYPQRQTSTVSDQRQSTASQR